MTTKRTKKAKKTTKGGKTVYGPYKGSDQNDGRPIYVEYSHKKKKTTSTNAARHEKEKATGRKLSRDQHVAHKGRTNKDGNKSTSPSSTRVESAKKNIGDGNRTRRKTSSRSKK